MARAEVPDYVVDIIRISSLTILLKRNRRIRGISAANIFRRLVTKTIAQQKIAEFRNTGKSFNFGLSDRNDTDAAIHFLRFLSQQYPEKIKLSIDGIRPFDHITRAQISKQLLHKSESHDLIPFIRLWYGRNSEYRWTDDRGDVYIIRQGDGGE